MSSILPFLLLVLSVFNSVNGGTHQLQRQDITYVDGHTNDDLKTGPKSAKQQISSQNFAEFINNNQANNYQNPQLGNNQNARYIVQSNGAPTIQTIYQSSSISPTVSYQQTQTNSESSNQHNMANSQQSSSATGTDHIQFFQPIFSNQGYQNNQNQNAHGIGHGDGSSNFAANQNVPVVIQTSTPGYQSTTASSGNSFESSSQSSSSSSSKSSSQFNSQTTTANPIYQPQIVQVTTPHSVQYDNNQHGTIDGSSTYLPPIQTGYQSSTPATNLQSFESSSQSSSDHQSHSESSNQSNQKTFVTTTVGTDIPQSHLISMSVTPTPYTISVSTPQTHEISHSSVPITPFPIAPPSHGVSTPQTYEISQPPVPITPIPPVHQHVPVPPVPVYKPIIQPAPFAVPVGHYYNPAPQNIPVHQTVSVHPAISVLQPSIHAAPFTPAPPIAHHAAPHQPAIHHVPVVTEIPVHEVQEDRGVVEKTVNVPQHGIKTQTYEIRRPAIQKQFYDIEERVIVRPAGSVVVEIDQPLSKTAKGGEVIVPVGGDNGHSHGISEGHNNEAVLTHGNGNDHNSGSVNTVINGHKSNKGHNSGVYNHGISQSNNNEAVYTGNQGHHQFITTGGNNYQHVVGTFGYYPYPNICDQYSQKFSTTPFVSIHHPSIVHQQFQPVHHGVASTTHNPFLSATSAPLNIEDDDSVVINAKNQQPNEKYIDSTTQSSQISTSTVKVPISHNANQQQPTHTDNSNNRQMPHMITVGDPDFQSPPYVEIQPNGEAANKVNNNNAQYQQQQPAIRGDLHNTGAHTLYTMQSVMNDEYLNPQQNQQLQFQPINQQPNFNNQQLAQQNQQHQPIHQQQNQQLQFQPINQQPNFINQQLAQQNHQHQPIHQQQNQQLQFQPINQQPNFNNQQLAQQNQQHQPIHQQQNQQLQFQPINQQPDFNNQQLAQQNQQPQPINQQYQAINQPQQVNFNQHQPNPSQQVQNNSSPHIVYAISVRNPNNYVATHPQQRQLVFPQQNAAYTIQQQQPPQYNAAYRQQLVQSPQQFTPQRSAPYIIAGNQQGISHSPTAYSSSYYHQQIPNTPTNIHFSPFNQGSTQYNHYPQNIPNGVSQEQYKNPRLHTGPSVFPQQEYEKQSAAYTQPQNFNQQFPSQQAVYTQNAPLTQAPQNYNNQQQFTTQQVFNNQNNQPQQIQEQNQQNFVPQENNTQSNSQINQESPVQISFNESDNYPIINIRNSINNTNGNAQPIILYNNTNNTNESNTEGNNNPLNTKFRDDTRTIQQADSQPQSSSITGQYENGPSVNINFQPNENQKQLLDVLLSHQGSSDDINNNNDLLSKSHVISATPAPKYSEPAGERVHTRRIVVNQPLETVQVVQEQTPVTHYKQVTVQQPTVHKTSRVGLKRVESLVPIFIQPQQHLPGYETTHYNTQYQPFSYSFVHRK